mgnify:CR=1 FL=1
MGVGNAGASGRLASIYLLARPRFASHCAQATLRMPPTPSGAHPPSRPIPAESAPRHRPADLELASPAHFRVVWDDGREDMLPARLLRQACPCAQCVEEGTGRQLLDPATVPETIVLTGAELVGRYAVSFTWSDGHNTVIFTWPHLRALGARD